ncbi:saccharopine dehydrogenase [Marmoricola endophyticus]|uniref:Saccharopine dehydrogenase n=1 Tax=Marmoricola endophyticus TaxID=2040280 RepID=A0A917BHS7_9ACTN|nr:saccharopine dehydrogenase NADP-binding domain-containing protein [Marmoricola endophyticus]GGF41721.1 saccharopine dehydrogenase [Marmoricola endophyticus]
MSTSQDRPYDIVLLGATGFTGRLTAAYLAEHAPSGLRWALAGRNRRRLEEVRRDLADLDPDGAKGLAELPLLHADSTDADSLAALAACTRVLVTTVGPYVEHGAPLVAACAAAGTDYLDLTGEPEFVDRMYLAHHEEAVASGARLVHCCGFDSIPHDLGAYFTVQQLPEGEPVTMRGVVRAGAGFSGGTFHSALAAFSRGRQMAAAMKQRRAAEPRPSGRSVRARGGRPHRDPVTGYWLLPLPTIDAFVVARSAAALERYGPRFTYSHYAGTKTLRYAAGGAAGMAALLGAAQVPVLRRAILSRVPAGEGPSPSRRSTSWFTVDFVAEAGGRQVRTRVSGGDPGYDETAKMLAESALCLAMDDNPPTSGQVTTAVAMGDHLLSRLQAAGLRFEVLTER